MPFIVGHTSVVARKFARIWDIFGFSQGNEKTPEAFIFRGFQRLGERIRTSGLLNPIQSPYYKTQGFEGFLSVIGR